MSASQSKAAVQRLFIAVGAVVWSAAAISMVANREPIDLPKPDLDKVTAAIRPIVGGQALRSLSATKGGYEGRYVTVHYATEPMAKSAKHTRHLRGYCDHAGEKWVCHSPEVFIEIANNPAFVVDASITDEEAFRLTEFVRTDQGEWRQRITSQKTVMRASRHDGGYLVTLGSWLGCREPLFLKPSGTGFLVTNKWPNAIACV